MQLAGELQDKWVKLWRHTELELVGIEVWEGIAGVMILKESGSRMSTDAVSWDWRRIQSFVVDNEMKFRVGICK